MKIWIILPAYNEEQALPGLLDSLIKYLSEWQYKYSILIINDGSTDRTGEIAKAYKEKTQIILIQHKINQGLASAICHGLTEAAKYALNQDVLITMDADLTHPPQLIQEMIQFIKKENDVVIASRFLKNSQVHGVPLYRRVLSVVASRIIRIGYPTKNVRDFTCGYRAYRAGVIQALIDEYQGRFTSRKGFSCMVEILLRLRKAGAKFAEVPISLRYDLKQGPSKLKIIPTIFDTLNVLFNLRSGKN